MNIVLNFLPLKSGGGVQVGLDFISNIDVLGKEHNWYLVCTEGTPFVNVIKPVNMKMLKVIRNNPLSRMWFELIGCRQALKDIEADVIYTQFGPYWAGSNVKNVVGCAYSNLMYPEVDFWGALPPAKKFIKTIIDMYRKYKMLRSDVLIFETEDLANRAKEQNGIPDDRVYFVKPSPSTFVNQNRKHQETEERCIELPVGFKVLLLAGYHPNKNIELLPKIAEQLKKRGRVGIKFIVTLPVQQKGWSNIKEIAKIYGVEDAIYNFGPVPPEGCSELYRNIDIVILPARLESFSNNIAESWIMDRPFMISDLDWSRSICGEGAVYFEYDNPGDAAEKIIQLMDNVQLRKEYVKKGRRMLEAYPDSKQRFSQYLDIIEKAKN